MKKGSTTTVATTVTSIESAMGSYEAILNPAGKLKRRATYVATVTTEAKDLAGNALDQDPNAPDEQEKVWTFKVRR